MAETGSGRGARQVRAARWPGGFPIAVRGRPPRAGCRRNLSAELAGLLAALRRLLDDAGDPAARLLAETVRRAAAEAFRAGAGEVAVVQDRIDGRPGLVVLHRRPDEPFPRIVDEIVVDLPALSARAARRWPAASSPRARVWRFVAGDTGATGTGFRP